jgi:putative polyhydroxyalkanoate system protein
MSKPITVDIPHKLGKAEARRRIEKGFGEMREQFTSVGVSDVTDQWSGDTLNFVAKGLGQTIRGSLEVLEDALRIELHLPLFLSGMADKIVGKLKDRGRLMLEKK